MNNNWTSKQVKLWLTTFLSALEQTANRWSSGIFVLVKTLSALFGLVVLMAVIVISTQWFLAVYGAATFVLTLILASFALSVLSTMANKKS
jgi:hypothetical protein